MIQNLLGMNLGLDFLGREDVFDDAFLVDEIGRAEDADGLSSAGHFLAPASELLEQGRFGVSDEGNCSPFASANFFCRACLSLLTPMIAYPAAASSS